MLNSSYIILKDKPIQVRVYKYMIYDVHCTHLYSIRESYLCIVFNKVTVLFAIIINTIQYKYCTNINIKINPE